MNDRFKFRVWDKKERKLLNVGLIDFRCGNAWFEELISDDSPYGILRECNFEIMQCTGLKDKNGKLIFENDVVKVNWLAELGTTEIDCEHIGIIKFYDCGFYVMFNPPYKRFIAPEQYYEEMGLPLCESSYKKDESTMQYEVIGNIHQNRELLEKGGK